MKVDRQTKVRSPLSHSKEFGVYAEAKYNVQTSTLETSLRPDA